MKARQLIEGWFDRFRSRKSQEPEMDIKDEILAGAPPGPVTTPLTVITDWASGNVPGALQGARYFSRRQLRTQYHKCGGGHDSVDKVIDFLKRGPTTYREALAVENQAVQAAHSDPLTPE